MPTTEPDPLETQDPSLSGGERSFRQGWRGALRRDEAGRPLVSADYLARQGRAVRVVDLRAADALLGPLGHVPGTDWVPLTDAGDLHRRLAPFEPLVTVCEDGRQSAAAAAWLEAAGLRLVAALQGGIRAWREAGLSVARDPSLTKRSGELSPLPPWEAVETGRQMTIDEIVAHIGHPLAVRWIKVAAFVLHGRMACVDGRDHTAVVGSPGGDAGELVLAFAAFESVTGVVLSPAVIDELMLRRVEALGRFAFHTDIDAMERLQNSVRTDPRTRGAAADLEDLAAFRRFLANPPPELREPLLDLMVDPDHVGCGHLRLTIQRPEQWSVRPGLTQQVLRSTLSLRWRGVREFEVTPLAGGHAEGAVVNIHVAHELAAFSSVPLVAPSISGRQMFVNHPAVARFVRRQLAGWLSQQTDILPEADMEVLRERMAELHARQIDATLRALAPGLPVFDVTVHPDGRSDVRASGNIPAPNA